MDIYSEFLALLEAAIKREGNAVKLGEAIGITSNLLTRWRSKSRVPTLSNIQPVLDYWGARLEWAGNQQQKKDSCGKPMACADKDTGSDNSSKILELEKTVSGLQAELEATRKERDMAQGEVRALERQLARLTPAPTEKENALKSTGELHGEAVRAG